MRVIGWAAIASSPLGLVVSMALWRRSKRTVVVLIDARRGRLHMDVLLSCWEQAQRDHPGRPVALWAFARGGVEHAVLEVAADLPVRCFAARRDGFLELRLTGR